MSSAPKMGKGSERIADGEQPVAHPVCPNVEHVKSHGDADGVITSTETLARAGESKR